MTDQEAIERLKCMRAFMEIEDKKNACKFLNEDYEANKIAIEALEKQIPHKFSRKCVTSRVPICGKCDGIIDLLQGELNYCPNCGQKVDWS